VRLVQLAMFCALTLSCCCLVCSVAVCTLVSRAWAALLRAGNPVQKSIQLSAQQACICVLYSSHHPNAASDREHNAVLPRPPPTNLMTRGSIASATTILLLTLAHRVPARLLMFSLIMVIVPYMK